MQNATEPKWDLIDRTAEALGVNKEARRKWRERNAVPYRWHREIVLKAGGELSFDEIPARPRPVEGAAA